MKPARSSHRLAHPSLYDCKWRADEKRVLTQSYEIPIHYTLKETAPKCIQSSTTVYT